MKRNEWIGIEAKETERETEIDCANEKRKKEKKCTNSNGIMNQRELSERKQPPHPERIDWPCVI